MLIRGFNFLVIFSLLWLQVVVSCLAGEDKKIVMAADPWCPYNCVPDSKLPGFQVEVVKAIFQPRGYTVEYQIMPWKRAIKSLELGEIDAVPGAIKGDAAGNLLGDKSCGKDETIVIVRKKEGFTFTAVSDLDGKRLGIIQDYSYDNNGEIDQYLNTRQSQEKGQIIALTEENALSLLLKMLVLDRVDVILENRFVASYTAQQLQISEKVEIIATGKKNNTYIAFSPNSKGQLLSKIFDQGIVSLRNSGVLTEILDKYGLDDWE